MPSSPSLVFSHLVSEVKLGYERKKRNKKVEIREGKEGKGGEKREGK